MFTWQYTVEHRDKKWLEDMSKAIMENVERLYDNKCFTLISYLTDRDRIIADNFEWNIYYTNAGNINIIECINNKTKEVTIYSE